MDWLEAIWNVLVNLVDTISNWFSMFFTQVVRFFSAITNVLDKVGDIILALYYGAKTLFSGIMSIVVDIFQGDLFVQVPSFFIYLGYFIGAPAVIILFSIFIIACFRIFVSFVFRAMKLNVDYKTLQKKSNK